MELSSHKESSCARPNVDSIKRELDDGTTEHFNRDEQYLASISDASVSQRQKIKNNRNQVRRERLKCDVCARPFICKSAMIEHSMVHTKEQPFECWLCHKK